ncbi:MAG: ornithine carbamoyltransferase [Candidatus Rokubacteria bacterium]|nr:ornithine carbamoyltransferase [Candidatus Rokubacteria bacterium]
MTAELKARRAEARTALTGRTLALLFEKPSLRTRVTFEVGMRQLGGEAIYLGAQEIQLGVREPVPDVARNLGRWVDAIAARTFRHATVEELARHAGVPVINALSDREHPCQALADFFTLWERGQELDKFRLAWIGDGNNVCHSLLLLAGLVGAEIVCACPAGYEPDPGVAARARELGARVEVIPDPREAATGADALYTDVWISMGQEAEQETRRRAFRGYQVNEDLLAFARVGAVVMHCLPAHRGEEISEETLDGPHSVVFDQAENRLHVQKALLLTLLDRTAP